ncbi:MAG: thioredoxin [Lachnospiraceae bacterium]|nr:thioredoxin [Lachnospiraceae bacterium]
MVKTITAENFEQEVVKSEKTVVLDFWASWCGPCRMFTPIIEKFAEDNPDVVVGKVNIDEQGALTEKFSIMSVPTLVIMKQGEVIKKSTGVIQKEAIEALLP